MANTLMPYDYVKAKLKNCDPLEIACKSGVEYDRIKKIFQLSVMGKMYVVQYPSGNVYDKDLNEVGDYQLKTLILRYLINSQGGSPTGKDISYRDVPGGQVYYRNFQGRCVRRLAGTFGKNIDDLEKVMAKVPSVQTDYGDISFRFQFINQVYITFILWQGDDEFPASANIIFDGNVSCYFDAEDLAVVCDIAIDVLRKRIRHGA